MQEGCTVNAEYYKGVLDRLISRIRRVCPALYLTRDFFLLHDDPAHSAAKLRQFLTQKQVATLNPPPHTRQICHPPNYFLFLKVKLQLKGAIFDTTEKIKKAVTNQLNKIPTEDFANAMKKLETCANLCITSNGSYFE